MDLVKIFESLDLAAIHAYVAEQAAETLHLDFKTVSDSELKKREDRKSYSEALSGFANSDGGLIVWGVDCRRVANQPDCAVGLTPIQDPKRFVDRLRSLEGDLVLPRVDGVEHEAIEEPSGAGYAVTIVPASDRPPHMARAGMTYFKRNGESFYPMEHFDVADMFGRRAQPRLELVARPNRDLVINGRTVNPRIMLALRNAGRGVARFPLIAIKLPSGFTAASIALPAGAGPGLFRRDNRGRPGYDVFFGGSDHVIHPETELDFATIGKREDFLWPGEIRIEYESGADGVALREDALVLPDSDYRKLLS